MCGRNDLVSVVIPSYNASGFIRATIQSVLDQTHQNFEIIVVDDCSKDATADVVRSFAERYPRVRLICLDRNYGAPAGPRNIGIQAAQGTWIAFLDADDIWHPDKLRCQIGALRKTGSKFCSTRMTEFSDAADLQFEPAGEYRIMTISFAAQLLKNRTPTSSVIVDADTIRTNLFNEDIRYKAREDFDCWLRCHEAFGHSIKIDHPMIGYRVSPQQISGNKLAMVKRHYFVLSRYRLRSGRVLGLGAALFTATHFVLSALNRRGLL